MSHQQIPKIRDYLATRPLGASTRELAKAFESSAEDIEEVLASMLCRGDVAKNRLTGDWRLTQATLTPPAFRARETLEAMQLAARGFE